jgi:hypothetical protein
MQTFFIFPNLSTQLTIEKGGLKAIFSTYQHLPWSPSLPSVWREYLGSVDIVESRLHNLLLKICK